MKLSRSLIIPFIALLAACSNGNPPAEFGSITEQIQAANQESRALAEVVGASLSVGMTGQSIKQMDIPDSSKAALLQLRQRVIDKFPNIINQEVWLVESAQLVTADNKSKVTPDLIGMYVLGTSKPDARFSQVWVATITANLRTKEVLNTAIAPNLTTDYVTTADRYQDASGRWPLYRFLVVGDPTKTTQADIKAMSLGEQPAPMEFIGTAGFNTDGTERAPRAP